jgi:hypothetical protein
MTAFGQLENYAGYISADPFCRALCRAHQPFALFVARKE